MLGQVSESCPAPPGVAPPPASLAGGSYRETAAAAPFGVTSGGNGGLGSVRDSRGEHAEEARR
jgi:hypothetical protein